MTKVCIFNKSNDVSRFDTFKKFFQHVEPGFEMVSQLLKQSVQWHRMLPAAVRTVSNWSDICLWLAVIHDTDRRPDFSSFSMDFGSQPINILTPSCSIPLTTNDAISYISHHIKITPAITEPQSLKSHERLLLIVASYDLVHTADFKTKLL